MHAALDVRETSGSDHSHGVFSRPIPLVRLEVQPVAPGVPDVLALAHPRSDEPFRSLSLHDAAATALIDVLLKRLNSIKHDRALSFVHRSIRDFLWATSARAEHHQPQERANSA
jgi:hypothetical protein